MLKDIWSASMTKIVRMKVWILVISLEQRSQWMAFPILLIVATSVSQILWHNKCAKMNHGLMIHDYCLFYNATSVDTLLYSTEITTFRTSIVAAEMFMNLGFDFWQKRKIELFILLTFSIVKKDLTISIKYT